jgi:hypothetical protein
MDKHLKMLTVKKFARKAQLGEVLSLIEQA